MDKINLAERMKTYYENIPKTKLMRRVPVAIRLDGKAFHTFTRWFKKPFDDLFITSMQKTMQYLCENIQGCVFGYTQSDEITLILIDYQKLNSAAWFDYEVQKICSISASMATMAFNKFFMFEFEEFNRWVYECNPTDEEKRLNDVYYKAMCNGAMFDARCFNIPKEEVTNLIYWRQLDATRNSIQMVGQHYFSHNQLKGKSCNDIQDMLFKEYGVNWNDYLTFYKRGSACRKVNMTEIDISNQKYTEATKWFIDRDMPILKGENRQYVDKYIYVGEE